jgi:hypothetical protein
VLKNSHQNAEDWHRRAAQCLQIEDVAEVFHHVAKERATINHTATVKAHAFDHLRTYIPDKTGRHSLM